MTQLCYRLEEAAQRLDMSETVLVRLSQYFKVPQDAYEELGYLSFKGDLSFSDQDIAFFRRVKEHLLAGESLETVKSRIREPEAAPQSTQQSFLETTRRISLETLGEQKLVAPAPLPLEASTAVPLPEASDEVSEASFDEEALMDDEFEDEEEDLEAWDELDAQDIPAALECSDPEPVVVEEPPVVSKSAKAARSVLSLLPKLPTAPLPELEAPEATLQAAETNFERYKGKNRPRGVKIFEQMIRQVNQASQQPSDKPYASGPASKTASKPKVKASKASAKVKPTRSTPSQGKSPAKQGPIGLAQTRDIEFERLQAQSADVASVLNERFPWKAHIQQASRHPRLLDERLKQAARLIREQTTGK